MKKNVGQVDRVLRGVVGLALIVFAVMTQAWWALIGLVPLLTGLVSFCPVYALFKIDTCPRK